ncbi:hypothetical protein [Apilactobacillus timberlakei]|nr:hypothetical protein [Apilactobacillus timberlakei]
MADGKKNRMIFNAKTPKLKGSSGTKICRKRNMKNVIDDINKDNKNTIL